VREKRWSAPGAAVGWRRARSRAQHAISRIDGILRRRYLQLVFRGVVAGSDRTPRGQSYSRHDINGTHSVLRRPGSSAFDLGRAQRGLAPFCGVIATRATMPDELKARIKKSPELRAIRKESPELRRTPRRLSQSHDTVLPEP
jgi:hypothetical protein